MQPWERRLRDLGHLLKSCGETYFRPDLFRRNTNQFLQTSRTVTFIIQKNKSAIPDYDRWYKSNVTGPWGSDVVMTWAKDARNVIEKEGDLDMQSTLHVAVLFSYHSHEDMVLEVDRKELLQASVDQLLKRAIKELPLGIADAALLKVQRRWVVNTLPDQELIYALTYAYGRLHEVCTSLCKHLGVEMDSSVLHPTYFDPAANDFAKVRYTKLSSSSTVKQVAERIVRDPDFRPSTAMAKVKDSLRVIPASMSGVLELHAKMAEATFNQCGNHMPMVFFYDEKWVQIDMVCTVFADQSDKFMFWRTMADRAFYMKAAGFVFVTEVWLRSPLSVDVPIRDLPIKGEMLQVTCGGASGDIETVSWAISRNSDGTPSLERLEMADDGVSYAFVEPLLAAMKLANASGVKTPPVNRKY